MTGQVFITPLATRALAVAKKHLGPAGEAFLRRQCRAHVGHEIEVLTHGDLKALAHWCFTSSRIVFNDDARAHTFEQEILALATGTGPGTVTK